MTAGPQTPFTMSREPAAGASAAELAELLRRVAGRDEAAFGKLYNLTRAKLYGVIFRILRVSDLSGEVLQEAYVRIWEKAGDFDADKGSPIAWMATIGRNRALDEVRKARPVSLEDMPAGFEPAADEVDPLASRDHSEQLSALLKCLETLDDEKREAVMMAYYRGASREAIAGKLNRPVPTIKTWLRRGLAQLRDCLAS